MILCNITIKVNLILTMLFYHQFIDKYTNVHQVLFIFFVLFNLKFFFNMELIMFIKIP